MRIVHILTRMQRGGSEENTAEVCRWQAAAGHEVWLIHGGDAHPCWHGAMPGVLRLCLQSLVHPVDPVRDLNALRTLRRVLRDLAADVVHTHQSKAGVLGRLAAAGQGARVVHGMHIMPAEGTLMRAAERRVTAVTHRFIGVSHAVCAAHLRHGLAREADTVCVRSGLDLERFRNAAPPPDRAGLLGLDPLGAGLSSPPTALFLAALEPRKNHAAFLHAWAAAAAIRPDARLLIAGDGPLAAELGVLVQTLGLGDRVRFLGHRDDPERLIALADVVCLPSEREGLPRVAVQALAGGRPFIGTMLPGLTELVVPQRTGLVVDGPGAVARATLALLADPARLRSMQAQARRADLSDWALSGLGPATTRAYARQTDASVQSSDARATLFA
ncbi:Glycosyltransferase involved in cell wall bisynthesis [Roseivivax lentus]|uniref:Glycosyltransferase involved in cell wall bisynthesis n=1 Tax=Roseivivax lentus TaxID=633194 RepID=A0A1N7P6Q1_9RHOB|nr:glycosyltransferase [Roseivivax lentus]SIT06263.1 Glycosyltransferase involved in cell wall bisynthesis [Roseivivax lentus]